MKRSRIGYTLLLIMVGLCLFACGAESDTEEGSSDGTGLQTYSDDVKECTPYLGDSSLSDWSEWNPAVSESILMKLFDPEIGRDECIYNHIDILDAHIEMINEFSSNWDTDGDYTVDDMTATIDNTISSVDIPYINIDLNYNDFFSDLLKVQVDRVITLSADEDLTIHMGFAIEDNSEILVEQYEIGDIEAGVYFVKRDDSSNNIKIWHASITSKKVQFMWEGDTRNQWFRITESTNTTGNWEVMGGGSIADSDSEMAFMARNDDNNLSNDEYYITLTLQELNDAVEVDITNAATTPPGGTGVLSYITGGNTDCFGFLDAFPSSASDLLWNN